MVFKQATAPQILAQLLLTAEALKHGVPAKDAAEVILDAITALTVYVAHWEGCPPAEVARAVTAIADQDFAECSEDASAPPIGQRH